MIKLKKGALRAMSWLYEAVNPVMDGLDYDLEHGERHSARYHVFASSRPILRDFLRCCPEAKDRFAAYDLAVEGRAGETGKVRTCEDEPPEGT